MTAAQTRPQRMIQLARMIDANLNRASEGLRMMEDVARFVLSSHELAAECKSLRHALRGYAQKLAESLPGFDSIALLAARDTPGDVGTAISTPTEYQRPTLAAVVSAAGARTAEALRVLEESAKLAGAAPAAKEAEAARYRTYDLHKRLAIALGAGEARQWTVCVLITESLCTHMPWQDVAKQALAGGADCLQLREKSLDGGELLRRARELVALARPHGAAVFINDRPDIALLAGADGVHVGQGDLPISQVRTLVGSRLLVGVSTGSMDEARAAAGDGADVCGVGPMFQTQTKHKPVLAGPEYLRSYLADPQASRVPHLAIGGIGPDNVSQLARVGCRGVAVSSCVCSAADPAEVCRRLRRELLGE